MEQSTVTFVTAFIDLNEDRDSFRKIDTYVSSFKQLALSKIPICLYVCSRNESIGIDLQLQFPNVKLMPTINLEDTITYKVINKFNPDIPILENINKDTKKYIILMNTKSEFVYNVSLINPFNTDHFAWVDFGIFHIISNPETAINNLYKLSSSKLKDKLLLFPSCWSKEKSETHMNKITKLINWRFCGGFFIGDKKSIQDMYLLIINELPNFIKHSGKNIIIWEVNYWAWLESKHNWIIDTYHADHNDTIINIPNDYINNINININSINNINFDNIEKYKTTIVTFYFNIKKLRDTTEEVRPQSFYMEKGRETLKLHYPMVIFCDEDNYKEIKKIRDEYVLNPNLTKYIIKFITEYDFYKDNWDIINENRKGIEIYKNSRNTVSYFLLTMFKIIAINIAKQNKFYNTDYYAWIDFGGSHIVRDFNNSSIKMLNNPNPKISWCYIHYRSHEDLYPITKFYKNYDYCGIAATVFTVEKDYVNRFYNGCLSLFYEALHNGVGHAEEQIFTYFYDKYPELCNIYFGDYYSVLSNYHEPLNDLICIKLFYIDKTIQKNRKDLTDICIKKIVETIKKHNINIYTNDLLFLQDILPKNINFNEITNNSSKNELNFTFTESNVFCIILENNPREINIIRRMKELELPYTKWIASTPKTLIDNFSSEILNDFIKGCAQSHINIWRHIVNNNIEYALILEDDACFDKNWKHKLNNFNTDIDNENISNWDCILLSASEPVNILNKWMTSSWQYSTVGYIISKKGAKWILDNFKNCFYPSDHMTLALQTQGNCYTYFPWLVIQDGINSTIGSDINFDNEKIFNNLSKINYSLDNYII